MKAGQLDSVCDEFEAAYRAGSQPVIENFITKVPDDQYERLLEKILPIELRWRSTDAELPTPAEYKRRFPQFESAVNSAFELLAERSAIEPHESRVILETVIPDEETVDEREPEPPIDLYFTIAPEEQSQARSAVDRLCSAWESTVPGGNEPIVAQYVPDGVSAELRRLILHQLLVADVECRKNGDRELQPDSYFSQFPDEKSVVESALKHSSSEACDPMETTTDPAKRSGSVSSFRPQPSFMPADTTTRYQAMRLHAKGGLGVVYQAKDKELNRTVALKEIQLDYALEPDSQARFVFEAEVTGSLEHPGIVPVYGLGRHADSRPYYAMRFIRGASFKETITEFHQANPSPSASVFFAREFKSLLRRLIETCNAIHYAHKHGVLHRDIKPDNVMLGDYGETLVVDWGLAKLINSDHCSISSDGESNALSNSSGNETSLGSAMGTPQYMSPEQAFGHHDTLTYASDVYSLGGVLLNIVTGQHPIAAKHATEGRRLSGYEIVRKVQHGEVQSVRALMPTAPGALASIVEKAMGTDPSHRYATAAELADDIDRWLNDEMVTAHVDSETLAERAGRLVRRYRSWTLSTAAALIVIAVVAVIAALWINNAKRKEHLAKLEARQFKQEAVDRYRDSRTAIDTWLVQSDAAMKFLPGTQSVRRRMLQVAIEDYEKLATTYSRDPDLELERGRALLRLGDLSQMQFNFEKSRDYYQQAVTVFAKSIDGEPPTPVAQAESANAQVRIGLAYAGQEQLDQADAAYQDAITKLKSIQQADASANVDKFLASAYVNAAELNMRREESQLATENLAAAIAVYQSALTKQFEATMALGQARAYEILGRNHARLGDHSQALKQWTLAAGVLNPLVQSQPDHPDYLDALASVYVSRATSYRAQGSIKNEIESLEQAAKHFRALQTAMPDMPLYIENLALTLTDLGIAFFEFDLAKLAFQQLIDAHERSAFLVDSYGQVPRFRVELAACQDALGQTRLMLDEDASEAAQLLADAVVAYERLCNQFPNQPEYFERLVVAQGHYGQALDRLGEHDAAVAEMQLAIKTLGQVIEAYPDRPRMQNALAHLYANLGVTLHQHDSADGQAQFAQALATWTDLCKGESPASYQADLAWLLAACPFESLRDTKRAIEYASDALASAPLNPTFTTTLALAQIMDGNTNKTMELIEQSRILRGELIGRDLLVRAMAEFAATDQVQATASILAAKKWLADNAPHDPKTTQLLDLAESMIELNQEK